MQVFSPCLSGQVTPVNTSQCHCSTGIPGLVSPFKVGLGERLPSFPCASPGTHLIFPACFPNQGLPAEPAFSDPCLTDAFCPAILCCFLPCRDELKRHYNLGQYWVEVEMEDLASFDEDLADYLYKQPTEHLQLVRMDIGNPEYCHESSSDILL